jgi:Holliday junction resolvasome RuvABC endonuclease subunit
MTQPNKKDFRVLSVAPSYRGFGFVVLEGEETIVEATDKTVKGDKNAQVLKKVEALISHYQPHVLVMENTSAEGSRRWPRIRTLCKQIIKRAESRKVRVKLYSREQVMKTFLPDGGGTKHDLTEIMAKRFPEQLASQLPPKRKFYMNEDPRMAIFDAVALALMFRLKRIKGHNRCF